LESFNQFRQSGGRDLLRDAPSPDLEALQQRCLELESMVSDLKRSKRRTSKGHGTSSEGSLPGTPGAIRQTSPSTISPAAFLEQEETEELVRLLRRAERAEQRSEVLTAELSAAAARVAETEDAASAKVAASAASLRASEAACLAAVEAARDATEARRRIEDSLAEEAAAAQRASRQEMSEAAAAKTATEESLRAHSLARSRAHMAHQIRAEHQELDLLRACFASWRLELTNSRLSACEESLRAWEAKAKDLGSQAASQARRRTARGMEAALELSDSRVVHAVFAAWRTSLKTRRQIGSLQAALFAEEADRASALRAQRSECDVLLLQAEARHRIALQKLRSELAEAQARQKEATAAERLALQAAVRAEAVGLMGWPIDDAPETEDTATEHPTSPESDV